MPRLADVPEGLRPYVFHGLDLQYRGGSKEAISDCPFCGREGKFSVNLKTSQWQCFVCCPAQQGEGGNQYKFVQLLWERSLEQPEVDYSSLMENRGIKEGTLRRWGVVPSLITNQWLVPAYNTGGEVRQVYKYANTNKGYKLLATPSIGHYIHGINLYGKEKKVIYLCEGPWDAMKLWEVLNSTTERKGRFIRVKPGLKGNLLEGANVLAVPGCTTFRESWSDVFLRKRVYVVYDNDYPKQHPKTGQTMEPAGFSGMRRVSGILRSTPEEIKYLRWGEKGYDPDLPDSMDVRDVLRNGKGIKFLHERLETVPGDWLISEKEKELEKRKIFPKKCEDWEQLQEAWKQALYWTEGLDVSLSVMLASVISTNIVGDQLWVKIIGPASCGKSTLSEALSVARKYVTPKDTFTGLTSGYQLENKKSGKPENLSLAEKLDGKTLIINDGDTLLQVANLNQIVSQLRAFYGRNLRAQYKNRMSKDFEGISMTMIVCGTDSLRALDQSELGERYLDCVIMEGVDDEMEDRVLMEVIDREDKAMSSFNGEVGSHHKEMERAIQLTGGYVEYLRENDRRLLSMVTTPHQYKVLIARIGKFVAHMRARPSKTQIETQSREFGARLVSQHLRLAKCLTAVLGKQEVDEEVMERVHKVAMDTARGLTMEMCLLMYNKYGSEGVEVSTLALVLNQTDTKILELLRFLKRIGVVTYFQKKTRGIRARGKWKLTDKMNILFEEVMG